MAATYAQTYAAASADPESFWLSAAEHLDWGTKPTTAIDASRAPIYSWFPGGTMNISYNALDRHVRAGRGEATALIYDSAVLGIQQRFSYSELLDQVSRFAGVLRSQGVREGDRVLIYLPMIPQAHIAMLASARLGAIHSVVFGGFAPKELAARIDDATPVAIVTATGGIEPSRRIEYLPAIEDALSQATHEVPTVIVAHRDGFAHELAEYASSTSSWHDWDELLAGAEPVEAVSVPANHPLYILYTSGTTGAPKGVVRDTGGYAVAMDWSMRNIYGVGPGGTMLTASDVGWVVGHSYIVYGPLIAGATTVLYEGKPVGTPDAGAFWRLIQDHKVNAFFTAPTALRAIRKADPHTELLGSYNIESLQTLFVAGERLDPDTYEWACDALGVPVVDNWWQTETGWPIASNPVGLELMERKAGSPTVPVPGYQVGIVDGFGEKVQAGEEGNIVIELPLPPGTLATLWGNDERFISTYLEAFPGYYTTGDSGYVDADGYLFVMGRTDDVINVSGHRLSTGSMEQVLGSHQAVAECAVIGVADELKGQRPSGYVVLKSGTEIDEETLGAELVALIRKHIGPVADFREVRIVEALPKTRSGKILRKTMRQIADGKDYTVPSTIEDPSVIEDLLPFLLPTNK